METKPSIPIIIDDNTLPALNAPEELPFLITPQPLPVLPVPPTEIPIMLDQVDNALPALPPPTVNLLADAILPAL